MVLEEGKGNFGYFLEDDITAQARPIRGLRNSGVADNETSVN